MMRARWLLLFVAIIVTYALPAHAAARDGNETGDSLDHWIDVPNDPLIPNAGGKSPLDSDGYGTACDFNTGGVCGKAGYSLSIAYFGGVSGPSSSGCALPTPDSDPC